jgi:P27 family predicted phage terminase small subunit
MPAGRPRKPEALRRLHGDKPDRFNHDEPTPPTDEPTRPETLTPRQVEIWDRVTADLRGMRLLHRADQDLLMQYVVAVERAEVAAIAFSTQPMTVRNPANGLPMSNPLIKDWMALSSHVRQLAAQFGLSPSSRSSIRVKDTQMTPPAPVSRSGVDRLFSA